MKRLIMTLFVLVFAVGMGFAQSNETSVSQLSDNNEATVAQEGMDNKATVSQSAGNKNKAEVNQYNDPAKTGVIESTVEQVGSKNHAIVNASRKNNASSTTMQKQVGDNNEAFINQFSSLGSNLGSALTQDQQGDNNYADMKGSDNYSAEQKQIGNNNDARTSAGSLSK